VLELNPEALAIADALDAERKAKGARGAMHGIPVLIKDNIATADKMMTTAGSLALVGATVPRDAFVAQRLIPRRDGRGRVPAVEVMLNSPLISDLVFKGDVSGIKEIMKKSRELGMQTFDQALFDLYEGGLITYEDALRNADSLNDLRLEIKLHGKDAKNRNVMAGIGNLDIVQ
jgi:Tfp pilus assembly ATPase PilU